MVEPQKIFSFIDLDFEIPVGLELVAGLTGFTDAGSTLVQIADQIFSKLETRLILQFTNDELLDYRSRRPIMHFDRDHINEYHPPVLGLYLAKDEVGKEFLFLSGYEPDFRWETFTDSLIQICDILGVSSVTWIHSIPFPVPHTRPVGVTVSGNRSALIDEHSEWKPQTQVPGNVLHLLEWKLSQVEIPVAGFVLLVPHYLADSQYPLAAIVGLEKISSATGLIFPADSIRDEGKAFLSRLNEQLTTNEELQKLVSSLEAGYSSDLNSPSRAPIRRPDTKVPSADEIASELEGYLANREKHQDDEAL